MIPRNSALKGEYYTKSPIEHCRRQAETVSRTPFTRPLHNPRELIQPSLVFPSEESKSLSSCPASRRRIIAILIVPSIVVAAGLVRAATLLPRTEAREENDEHAEEEEHHRGQAGPHADGVEGVGAAAVAVDVVFDDLERVSVAIRRSCALRET